MASPLSTRGQASAVRAEARSGVLERLTFPERPKPRTFAAEHELRIVRKTDAALASGRRMRFA
jgi:hypothetical protein